MAEIIFRCVVLLGLLAWVPSLQAATVLLLRSGGEAPPSIEDLKLVTHSYGVGLAELTLDSDQPPAIPPRSNIRGVVVSAGAYRSESWPAYERRILESPQLRSLPLLIVDLAPEATSSSTGRLWGQSGIAVDVVPEPRDSRCTYAIVGAQEIVRELAGQVFPCNENSGELAYYLKADLVKGVEGIVETAIPGDAQRYPLFARSVVAKRETFFLVRAPATRAGELAESMAASFASVAPIAMFVRYVSGEYAWHSDGYYANFTIDDPWLHEPYGNLSYTAILNDMEKNRFHTSIAFVPWNFDRSEPAVVSLFRSNPDRLSLSIHGNNHDHEEFSEARSTDVYEKNIKQGLARMEELKKLTGLDYDRVMVFPHRIARPQALDLLRKYGFACTANLDSRRYPLGAQRPGHLWGSFVASEQGIPSLKRELPTAAMQRLAILLFLQTPILLHTHQEYFAQFHFGQVAAALNELRPDLRWVGLGSLCERLYLKKLEDDGRYRVLLFAGRTVVANPGDQRRVFVMERRDPGKLGFANVVVNASNVAVRETETGIEFDAAIDGRTSATIIARYLDETERVAPVDTAKDDLRVRMLRYASDFRDMQLSRTELGRTINEAYYSRMRGAYSRVDAILLLAPIVTVAAVTLVIILRIKRRRRS